MRLELVRRSAAKVGSLIKEAAPHYEFPALRENRNVFGTQSLMKLGGKSSAKSPRQESVALRCKSANQS